MQLYRQILRITEEIEHSLKNEAFESLISLQRERQAMFGQLQVGSVPGQPEKMAELIRLIRSSEDRCMTLAKARKTRLGEEMGATGRAKKLHNAYGRQALAY